MISSEKQLTNGRKNTYNPQLQSIVVCSAEEGESCLPDLNSTRTASRPGNNSFMIQFDPQRLIRGREGGLNSQNRISFA